MPEPEVQETCLRHWNDECGKDYCGIEVPALRQDCQGILEADGKKKGYISVRSGRGVVPAVFAHGRDF